MNDHTHPESQVPERDRPTRAQLRCLRGLAGQLDQTFATPRTKAEASRQITRLQRATRGLSSETRVESTYPSEERSGIATAIRDDEITGYGATARWA
jgi:hypothetical protein